MESAGKNYPDMTGKNQEQINSVNYSISKRSWFSVTSFGIMIISFFFTFCVFTCGGVRIPEKAYTGIDLMTIRMEEDNHDFGFANILTALAFLSAIIGLILSFFSKNFIPKVVAGFAGVFFLMLLYVYIIHQIKQSSEAMAAWIVVKFKFGYFLALISGLTARFWNLRNTWKQKSPRRTQALDSIINSFYTVTAEIFSLILALFPFASRR